MLSQMSAPSEPRVQADTGGLVVTDDGRRVLVIDRGTGALSVLAFVLGVLALVVGGFGCVALIAGIPSRALGATFLAVGFVFAPQRPSPWCTRFGAAAANHCTNAAQSECSTASWACSVTAAER